MFRTLADAALAVLLAPCCATCGGVLERPLDGAVCAGCWARVACFSPPLCAACGEPLPSARTHPGERCGACSITLGAATVARSVGAFDGMLADVVRTLKYGRRPSVARPLAALMRRAGGELLAGIDVAVPVPLHRRRLRERGFNQAEALARGLGVPLCHALRRARFTPAQVVLSGDARRVNLRGAFVLAAAAERIRGRAVVLVDDVLTTGATVTACADALAAAAPRRIVVLTAARAVSALRR
jgi:ComF family protein